MSQQTSLTSLVYNAPYAKQLGVPPYYYRYRSCNPNFPNRTQTSVTGFSPADQYQKLQIIQKTVRVYGSLYTANLGPLTAYKPPITDPDNGLYGVCWNQMSDRPIPSMQKATIPSGFNTSLNRRHTSVTSSKPGSQTPGGKGCDIKHNSYDRYLNRLKGKGPMKRGKVPPDFGKPILFNPAFPIYGGKTVKTSIINDCQCFMNSKESKEQDVKIYDNPLWQPYPSANLSFNIGDYVYAIQTGKTNYSKAIVISKTETDEYTIQFSDGFIQTVSINELLIYFPCDCDRNIDDTISFPSGLSKSKSNVYGLNCDILKSKLNI